MFSFIKKYMLKKAVTDKDMYYIVSAVRGPDSQNDNLKYIFTARIRWLVGRNDEIASAFRREKKVRLSTIVKAIEEVNEYDYHYLVHVGDALDEMVELGLISEREYGFLYKLYCGFIDLTKDLKYYQVRGVETIKEAIEKYSEFIK